MARKKNPSALKIGAGVALGILAAYGIYKVVKKDEPKKKKAPAIPEEPPGPGPEEGLPGVDFDPYLPEDEDEGPGVQWDPPEVGLGEVPVEPHRAPLPAHEVPVPVTPSDHLALDHVLCAYLDDNIQYQQPSAVAEIALNRIAPEVAWPTVVGDHPSLTALESIVYFRARQIGLFDPDKTVHENFVVWCDLIPEQAQVDDIIQPGG